VGKGLHSSPPGPVQRGRTIGHPDGGLDTTAPTRNPDPHRGPVGRAYAFVRDYLPRGNTLDDETFRRRHLLLCWILGLHVPALFAFGVAQGFGVNHSALEVAVPVACLAFARVARNRRLAAFFVTAGLVYCSSALVHLSNGTIEAHFHFFILIGLIALYQDWVPFVWNVVFTVLSHGLGSGIASDVMYNHTAAQQRPWHWAVVHGVAVLAACVGEIIFWKNTEREQERNIALVASMAAAEAEQRAGVSELLVNLARRNQSLLNRQLGLISDLEQRERQPEVLDELFQLDHLATRIRRNAESLLVLSGDEPSRLWGRPVPLPEVVRAAAAEVEEYRRVDVQVNDRLEVSGRAVADVAHLLAELIENATVFSPPNRPVLVRSHLTAGDPRSYMVTIEDVGIGMTDHELGQANEVLHHAPEVDLRRSTMLGFHVVARLAARYGIAVSVAATPGGGVTALVRLPGELVSERIVTPVAPAPAGPGASTAGAAPYAHDAWRARADGPTVAGSAPDDAFAGDLAPFPSAPSPVLAADPAPFAAPPAPFTAPPAPASPAPAPPAGPPPVLAAVVPPEDDAPPSGLARRVPGASLAPALRSPVPPAEPSRPNGGPSAPAPPTPSGGPAGPTWPGPAPADPGTGPRDPERVRSMLSRFQASQRAGRAVSNLPGDQESDQTDPVPRPPEEAR
jgi:signal transduction histidine kinase